MLDRQGEITRINSEQAAAKPALSITWIERERLIDECGRRVDVLAEKTEREPSPAEGTGVIGGDLDGSPGQCESLAAISIQVIGFIVHG
jgi:hypothetical protein